MEVGLQIVARLQHGVNRLCRNVPLQFAVRGVADAFIVFCDANPELSTEHGFPRKRLVKAPQSGSGEVTSIQPQLTHDYHIFLLFRSRNLEDRPYLLNRAGYTDWDHDAPVPLERGHHRDGRRRGLLLLGLIAPADTFLTLVRDWNTFLFFLRMMDVSALAEAAGLFDWLAAQAARLAGQSAARLFLNVFLLGTLISMVLANDATALILTPIVDVLVTKLRLPVLPYLFAVPSSPIQRLSFAGQ